MIRCLFSLSILHFPIFLPTLSLDVCDRCKVEVTNLSCKGNIDVQILRERIVLRIEHTFPVPDLGLRDPVGARAGARDGDEGLRHRVYNIGVGFMGRF